MPESNKMSILQWNCRSLYGKLSHFKINLIKYRPHVVCLTETWLKPEREPKFANYTKFLCNREDSTSGGGLAILVRNDIICKSETLPLFDQGKLEVATGC